MRRKIMDVMGPIDGATFEKEVLSDSLHEKNLEVEALKTQLGKAHKFIVMLKAENKRLKNINSLQAADLREHQPEEESALEYWLKQFD